MGPHPRPGARTAALLATTFLAASVLTARADDGGSGITGAFAAPEPGGRAAALGAAAGPGVVDPTAIYWSPARLLENDDAGAAVTYADLFGLGLVQQTGLFVALPRRPRNLTWSEGELVDQSGPPTSAWGLGIQATNIDLEPDAYAEYDIALAHARRGPWDTGWAVVGHALQVRSDLENVSASGYAVDFALARPVIDGLEASLVLRSLMSSLSWKGTNSEQLAPRVEAGLCWRPLAGLEVPVVGIWDLEVSGLIQASGGVEWRPLGHALALRGGLRWRDDGNETEIRPAGGVGFAWQNIAFDYGLAIGREELGDTHRFGLSYQF
jgi:hypothetical protein